MVYLIVILAAFAVLAAVDIYKAAATRKLEDRRNPFRFQEVRAPRREGSGLYSYSNDARSRRGPITGEVQGRKGKSVSTAGSQERREYRTATREERFAGRGK